MAEYDPEENFEMLMVLGEAGRNYTRAADLYAQRHSNDRQPGGQYSLT